MTRTVVALIIFFVLVIIGLVIFIIKTLELNKSQIQDFKKKESEQDKYLEYEKERANNFEKIITDQASPFFEGSISDIEIKDGNYVSNSYILAKKSEDNQLDYLNISEWQDMIKKDLQQYKDNVSFVYNPFTQQLKHSASDKCVEASIPNLSASLSSCDNNLHQRWRITDKHIRSIGNPELCLLSTGKIKSCDEVNTTLSIWNNGEEYVNWADLTKRKYL